MKKLILVYVILIVSVVLLGIMRSGGNLGSIFPFAGGGAKAQVGKNEVKLILAKSNDERFKGLSGRKSLPEDQGMLFVFDKKDKYGFWMRDMLFPIDIIFLDDKKVVDVFENVPPGSNGSNLTIYTPSEPANYVLELNAGQAKKIGIKKGDTINLSGI